MLMPGRQFSQGINSIKVGPATEINGHSVPLDIVLYSRTGTSQVTDYVASGSISLMEGFESLQGDNYSLTIADGNYDGAGNEGIINGSEGTYRYGFNGKENDNEVKGTGNQQDYGMRIYDPRLGRFLTVDPLTNKYPELTPYQFASNRPIDGIDLDGLEYATFRIYVDKNQKVTKIDPPTKDYLLKNNGSEGPGVKYIIFKTDEANKPDEVRWSKNLYGIYQGGDNPKLPRIGANYNDKWSDNYDLDPIDEADDNAKTHDQDFDLFRLSGAKGILDDRSTTANKDYIKRANKIIEKGAGKEKDDVTGKPVTSAAVAAAEFGKKWFQRAETLKKDKNKDKTKEEILIDNGPKF